ncbi:DUF2207 domain-containing protein [Marinitenerispora sediminis]|uniref:DUF2207 domain-containing protein n=1 Tax=Marinitenerispora sediminis TaxID=1931232 RepID=A0A368T7P9_9ACTN|nr:DUF2207 domain-containing protein [Marinitenerispora sediminis]RCV51088.1 DUF2207 domain-containing protein [Marinitenerispora sediminis]RCV56585.1 DUF2207 domain-containing protein [Marinitenerispora sediminis]RCV60083.1 DUF2207 domain-containing protein [Marinitenerispora sediminis]
MWGVRFARSAVVATVGLSLLASLPGAAAAHVPNRSAANGDGTPAEPETHASVPSVGEDDANSNRIYLMLDSDGTLHAEETLFFGAGAPEEFTRTFVVRHPYDTDHDRLYEVSGITARDGDGEPVAVRTDAGADTLDVTMETGGSDTVVLNYEVGGTTSRIGRQLELEWVAVGGYSSPVGSTTVEVDAPLPPLALSCAAGEPRSSIYCTSSDMGGHQALIARFLQADLEVGQTLSIVVGYPPETAPGEPVLERTWSLPSAFAITPATSGVFGLLLIVLIGGLLVLIRVRGRDERALRNEAALGDHAPLAGSDEGTLRFRPPNGVHPGQIGTLIDEQADVVDITATVVDLAVKGHLVIEELPHEGFTSVDWRLVRQPPPPDDEPRRYERLLLDALFHNRDEVRLSELGDTFATRLGDVRDELYRDMVRLKWFARRPNVERNRWTVLGIVLTALGVLLTVLLALYTHAAFTGLAVIIAGAAVTVGAQYMPAKTRLGSAVFAHTLGFRAYLHRADADDVPFSQRVPLFSRYLPYAIIFDTVERWAQILATAGSAELDGDDLPWYHGPEEWRLNDFADSIRTFTLTLSGVISNTRQFRTLS